MTNSNPPKEEGLEQASKQPDLNQIEQRALELASKSSDPDSFLKASQALFTFRQLRGYKPTPVWPTVLTPITAFLAVLLTVVTLHNQTKESEERREAAEDSQWIDVMKQISLKDSSVQMGILGVQGFFDSQRHGKQAREVATILLPLTDNKDAFEIVLKGLVQHTNADNQRDLIGIARTIAYNEWDVFNGLKSGNVPEGCPVDDVVAFLNAANQCYRLKDGEELPVAKRAWLYSWEIDSMSDVLGKLWQRGLPSVNPDKTLSALILVNNDNLKNLDFSRSKLIGTVVHLCDLSGASFNQTDLSGAVFHQIQKFEGSTWKEANWWQAESISCGLSEHLAKNYWPSAGDQQDRARQILANCTADEE